MSAVTADAAPHAIEAALVGRWRALVDELRGWMPEHWHAAITWAGTLVGSAGCGIPRARRRRAALDAATTPCTAILFAMRARRRVACSRRSPSHGRIRTDSSARGATSGRVASRRSARTERTALTDCARLLIAHRAALADPSGSDGAVLRRALVSRLSVLYRRATLEPAAAFIFLALSALDMERLRGELLRRAIFPRLGLAA